MTIKSIVAKQYQDKVNRAAIKASHIESPPEGWLCTVRKALGMSAAQLARRLGVTRAQVSKTEKGELNGSVTLKTLQNMAEAMGCRLTYAIIPETKIEDILAARAQQKASRRVEEAHKHMALEDQTLSQEQITFEVERLQKDILQNSPADLWDDEA
ncbi:MAG: mobile mystery protein A [Nitrospirales bacterium]|nr:mobile mystery protein A [Nitrospirales bacterium]